MLSQYVSMLNGMLLDRGARPLAAHSRRRRPRRRRRRVSWPDDDEPRAPERLVFHVQLGFSAPHAYISRSETLRKTSQLPPIDKRAVTFNVRSETLTGWNCVLCRLTKSYVCVNVQCVFWNFWRLSASTQRHTFHPIPSASNELVCACVCENCAWKICKRIGDEMMMSAHAVCVFAKVCVRMSISVLVCAKCMCALWMCGMAFLGCEPFSTSSTLDCVVR